MKVFVFISILAFPISVAFAQFRSIKVDDHGTEDLLSPSIAINPKNALNLVAVTSPGTVLISKDGGATWAKKQIQSSFGTSGEPSLIVDGDGTFFVFHVSGGNGMEGGSAVKKSDRIVIQRSEDGGETWSDGVFTGLTPPKIQSGPSATVDLKGNLVLTWTQFDSYASQDTSCHSSILMSTSKNGSKWSDPVILSQRSGNCAGNNATVMGARPLVTFDGKAFVAWSVNERIYMDRSYDGNLWLNNDIALFQQQGGWDFKIPGHKRVNGLPSFMTDRSKTGFRGYLYMVWSDQINGPSDTDIWFSRSTNYGDNWSSPSNINPNKKGHQYLPSFTIDQTNGNLYVLYYDRSQYEDLQTDVYLAWSTDGGSSFNNVKISEDSFIPAGEIAFADRTALSAHKGIIAAMWTRIDNGKAGSWMSVIKHADLEAKAVKK